METCTSSQIDKHEHTVRFHEDNFEKVKRDNQLSHICHEIIDVSERYLFQLKTAKTDLNQQCKILKRKFDELFPFWQNLILVETKFVEDIKHQKNPKAPLPTYKLIINGLIDATPEFERVYPLYARFYKEESLFLKEHTEPEAGWLNWFPIKLKSQISILQRKRVDHFKILPIQRLTRLPLFVDSLITIMEQNDDEEDDYGFSKNELIKLKNRLNKIVLEMNKNLV